MAKEAKLLPVYMAVGDDTLKRERVEERLTKRLSQVGDLSFNSQVFDGADAQGSDIVMACNTLPFASALRLVVVRNAEKLKAADARAVSEYLATPCETTVLALYATKLSKNSRLYKAVAAFGKGAIINCASVKKRNLPELVRGMAKSHSLQMTQGAIEELIERVGEDTVRLDSELRKLSLVHSGSDPVNEGEIALSVGRTNEVKPWEYTDAFAARNLGRCIYCLQRMPSASPYALMAGSVKRVRELIITKAVIERHQESQLAGALGLPASQAWKVKNYPRWANGYSADELRSALRTARDAEKKMKSGYDPSSTFLDWMIGVVAR
ncbi:MAG: DNA polymerase III subunit delta [Eggerthellaceae bacterium]|jgi:DNA polymerase-3 subunit delta